MLLVLQAVGPYVLVLAVGAAAMRWAFGPDPDLEPQPVSQAHRPVQRPAIAGFLIGGLAILLFACAAVTGPVIP